MNIDATESKPPWSRTEQRVALVAFALVTGLITMFLLRDASDWVNSAQDELIGHLGASGAFTIAASGTMLALRERTPSLLSVLLAGAAITIAAELAQVFVPYRSVQLRDIAIGFGAVMLTAVAVEVMARLFDRLASLRIQAGAAAAISATLLVILVMQLGPSSRSAAVPDGVSCPLTAIDGSGQRIDLANLDETESEDGCVGTSAGGLGIDGPRGSDAFDDDSVLISSPLGELAAAVHAERRLVATVEFSTPEFGGTTIAPGVLLILRSDIVGEVLQIRAREATLEVIGPRLIDPYRPLSVTRVLEPRTTHRVSVELTDSALLVSLDDSIVATNSLDERWLVAMADPELASDLTLYVGNAAGRHLAFPGEIMWIEVGT